MDAARSGAITALYAGTVLLSAALLFAVQPMFAKMALPLVGGAANVWTTAMLFFQSALLLGYAYAHLLAARAGVRAQLAIHAAVMAAGALFLPFAVDLDAIPAGRAPTIPLLLLMAGAVGAPFMALSANAPLLQSWFARTGARTAGDPYHLYAASNVGSVGALLAYPLLLEPTTGVRLQSIGWAAAYVALIVLILLCGRAALRARAPAGPAPETPPATLAEPTGPIRGDLAVWTALAFVPSGLMLAVTSFAATDLGSFPLLWAIPLALYLLTFVVAFSQRLGPLLRRPSLLLLPFALAAAPGVAQLDLLPSIGLLFAVFFVVALAFHGELARRRPHPSRLTAFFLAMSVGGALGGLLNSVVAPYLFPDVWELPLMLGLSALLLFAAARADRRFALQIGMAAIAAVAVYAVFAAGEWIIAEGHLGFRRTWAVAVGATGLALLGLRRFPLPAAVLAAAGTYAPGGDRLNDVVWRDRSFFGVAFVRRADNPPRRILQHGTTVHGGQILDEANRTAPTYYYSGATAFGDAIGSEAVRSRRSVFVVGLGVGSLACYSVDGQTWTFVDIDPLVTEIARDPALFDQLERCAPDAEILVEDGRRAVARAPDGSIDVLVLDAFASDAVPTHLLTLEAFEDYARALAPDGLMLIHISNRYFDLAAALAPTLRAANLTAVTRATEYDWSEWAYFTEMVLAAPEPSVLAPFLDGEWKPLPDRDGAVWTDDFSDLLRYLR